MLPAHSRPVTADFELMESDNMSRNFYIEDSSVGEPSTKCPSILSAAGRLSSSEPLNLPQPIVDISTETSSLQLDLPSELSHFEQCINDVCQLEPSEFVPQPHDLPQPVEDIDICQLEPSESLSQPLGLPQPVEDIDICQLEPSKSSSQPLDLPQPVEGIGICQLEPPESSQPLSLPQPVEDIGVCQLELSKSSSLSPDLPQSVVDISTYELQLPKSSLQQPDLPKPLEDVSVCQSQPSTLSLQPPDLPQSVVDIGICESQLSESSSQLPDLPQPVVDISTETSSLQLADCGSVSKSLSSMSQSEQRSTDVCQSETAVSQQQEIASEGYLESSLVVDHQLPVDHVEDVTETDKTDEPSTVIVISTHHNKDALTSCQRDMDCASTDITENDTRCETSNDPLSMSDLYMCCNDEEVQAKESVDNLPSFKQSESVYSSNAVSKNEAKMISDDIPATKRVVRKQRKYIYGMHPA